MSSSMTDPNTDPYGYMGFSKNSDGSISRLPLVYPDSPPSPEFSPDNPISVLSKDLPINQDNHTWARVYRPQTITPTAKLPLIVYFHGGGLVICSAATGPIHQFCCAIAEEIQAVIVSVDYRLGPEHRLPAAYDDCVEALHWVKSTRDEWLTNYADLSECFLMGSSAGGNITYHVGLRVVSIVNDLLPIKIRGLILHQPFFGGSERTLSEVRLVNDKVLPPVLTDVIWDLALPVGADRDHEYCNPTAGIKSDVLEKIRNQGWKVLVTGFEGDPLIDRQVELARMLKEKKIEVVDNFRVGGCHGSETSDESTAKIFYGVVKDFVLSRGD